MAVKTTKKAPARSKKATVRKATVPAARKASAPVREARPRVAALDNEAGKIKVLAKEHSKREGSRRFVAFQGLIAGKFKTVGDALDKMPRSILRAALRDRIITIS